jgi:hypothetical protein
LASIRTPYAGPTLYLVPSRKKRPGIITANDSGMNTYGRARHVGAQYQPLGGLGDATDNAPYKGIMPLVIDPRVIVI